MRDPLLWRTDRTTWVKQLSVLTSLEWAIKWDVHATSCEHDSPLGVEQSPTSCYRVALLCLDTFLYHDIHPRLWWEPMTEPGKLSDSEIRKLRSFLVCARTQLWFPVRLFYHRQSAGLSWASHCLNASHVALSHHLSVFTSKSLTLNVADAEWLWIRLPLH